MHNQSQNTSFIFLDLGQNGQCLLSVPAFVAENARAYQAEFDKWLQSSTEHAYWVTAPDGTKALCFDGAEAFVGVAQSICSAGFRGQSTAHSNALF